MSEFLYTVGSVTHLHDRYGEHHMVATTPSDHSVRLSPIRNAIPITDRMRFPSIRPGSLLHCQGYSDNVKSIVYKEPEPSDTDVCSCGTPYHVTQTTIRCLNVFCSRTELGRIRYFLLSFFQHTLSRQISDSLATDLVFMGITNYVDLLTKPIMFDGIVGKLIQSLRQAVTGFITQRDIYSVTQNSLILSFLDSLGLTGLSLSDIVTLTSNESIDYQNGEGGDSAQYYYRVLTDPDYLCEITGMPISSALRITQDAQSRRLDTVFALFAKPSHHAWFPFDPYDHIPDTPFL